MKRTHFRFANNPLFRIHRLTAIPSGKNSVHKQDKAMKELLKNIYCHPLEWSLLRLSGSELMPRTKGVPITIRGDEIKTLSPRWSLNRARHKIPTTLLVGVQYVRKRLYKALQGAAVVKWLSSWLAEQEVRGSIPGLAATISEIVISCFQVAIWLKDR